MPLPQPDPSNPALPAPLFADVDAVRGDHLRANNQLIWENLQYLFDFTGRTTDTLAEGVANLYFTAARTIASALTGYSSGSDAALAATDTILQAFAKTQGQISPVKSAIAALKNIVRTEKTTQTQYATTIPLDNSKPQSGEGSEIFTVSITPTNAANYIRVRAVLQFSQDAIAASVVIAALFKDAAANAIAVNQSYSGVSSNWEGQITIDYRELAGDTTARTYKLRAGSSAGEVFTVSGRGAANIFDGLNISSITASEEIA